MTDGIKKKKVVIEICWTNKDGWSMMDYTSDITLDSLPPARLKRILSRFIDLYEEVYEE